MPHDRVSRIPAQRLLRNFATRVMVGAMGTAISRKCLACELAAITCELPFCAVHHFKLPFELRELLLQGELVRDGVRVLGTEQLWSVALAFLRCTVGERPLAAERPALEVFMKNEAFGEVARVVGRPR